jgi:hypothetical protein
MTKLAVTEEISGKKRHSDPTRYQRDYEQEARHARFTYKAI